METRSQGMHTAETLYSKEKRQIHNCQELLLRNCSSHSPWQGQLWLKENSTIRSGFQSGLCCAHGCVMTDCTGLCPILPPRWETRFAKVELQLKTVPGCEAGNSDTLSRGRRGWKSASGRAELRNLVTVEDLKTVFPHDLWKSILKFTWKPKVSGHPKLS